MWGKLALLGACIGGGMATMSSLRDPDSPLYPAVVMPLSRQIDPERASGFFPREKSEDPPLLSQQCWGKEFPNPIGLAAGFDKNAESVEGLSDLGFGFIEIGSVTPLPQEGNPKPRVFRLVEDGAVINRYGFNSQGHAEVAKRLSVLPATKAVLGVNLGKNKTSADAIGDYTKGVESLGEFADYLVINVSSPNTPNLRDLQNEESLGALYIADKISEQVKRSIPVLIKIAPDLTEVQKQNIANLARQLQVDGIIISNTTRLASPHKGEVGGLSGKPLKELSTDVLKDIYERTEGKIPLIGVGGVFSGRDALDKIEAGASLVQVYSAIAIEGPGKVHKIKGELATLLKENGYKSVSEAVGKATKFPKGQRAE